MAKRRINPCPIDSMADEAIQSAEENPFGLSGSEGLGITVYGAYSSQPQYGAPTPSPFQTGGPGAVGVNPFWGAAGSNVAMLLPGQNAPIAITTSPGDIAARKAAIDAVAAAKAEAARAQATAAQVTQAARVAASTARTPEQINTAQTALASAAEVQRLANLASQGGATAADRLANAQSAQGAAADTMSWIGLTAPAALPRPAGVAPAPLPAAKPPSVLQQILSKPSAPAPVPAPRPVQATDLDVGDEPRGGPSSMGPVPSGSYYPGTSQPSPPSLTYKPAVVGSTISTKPVTGVVDSVLNILSVGQTPRPTVPSVFNPVTQTYTYPPGQSPAELQAAADARAAAIAAANQKAHDAALAESQRVRDASVAAAQARAQTARDKVLAQAAAGEAPRSQEEVNAITVAEAYGQPKVFENASVYQAPGYVTQVKHPTWEESNYGLVTGSAQFPYIPPKKPEPAPSTPSDSELLSLVSSGWPGIIYACPGGSCRTVEAPRPAPVRTVTPSKPRSLDVETTDDSSSSSYGRGTMTEDPSSAGDTWVRKPKPKPKPKPRPAQRPTPADITAPLSALSSLVTGVREQAAAPVPSTPVAPSIPTYPEVSMRVTDQEPVFAPWLDNRPPVVADVDIPGTAYALPSALVEDRASADASAQQMPPSLTPSSEEELSAFRDRQAADEMEYELAMNLISLPVDKYPEDALDKRQEELEQTYRKYPPSYVVQIPLYDEDPELTELLALMRKKPPEAPPEPETASQGIAPSQGASWDDSAFKDVEGTETLGPGKLDSDIKKQEEPSYYEQAKAWASKQAEKAEESARESAKWISGRVEKVTEAAKKKKLDEVYAPFIKRGLMNKNYEILSNRAGSVDQGKVLAAFQELQKYNAIETRKLRDSLPAGAKIPEPDPEEINRDARMTSFVVQSMNTTIPAEERNALAAQAMLKLQEYIQYRVDKAEGKVTRK